MTNTKERKHGKTLIYIGKHLARTKLSPATQLKALIAADIIINLVVVGVLVIFMRTFIMSPFQVHGISMCNTLNYFSDKCQSTFGDYIIINKSSYLRLPGWTVGTPQRGDIIVFRPPQNQKEFFIKRVIGLPGESLKLIDGYVYIYNTTHPEGIKLDETYLNKENLGNTFATGGIDQFKIPENHYFVLGDNRIHSSDSRLCFKESSGSSSCGDKNITPFLTIDDIEGKAALALWPNPRVLLTAKYNL